MGNKQPSTGMFRSREGIRLLTVAIVFLLVGSIASFVTVKIAYQDVATASSNAVSQAQEIKASNICRDHPEEPLCTNAQKIIDNPTETVQGPVGRPGTNGIDGKDGKNGIDGSPGPTGPAGEKGTDASDGLNGIDGLNGANGVDGLQGAPGIQGDPGVQGVPGPAGSNGISITAVTCAEDNTWQITFSSGEVQTVAGPCRVEVPAP